MADVSKIKLPDQSIVNIKDYRIPGVDTTPTSGSSNLITSGGVYQDIEDTSRVVSAALNDLNDRVVNIEDEWVTTEEYSQIEQVVRDTYTKQEIDEMFANGGNETDPIFSASPAAGITAANISNWNSKTSNTGTVIGSGLTEDRVILGDGGNYIYASNYNITTTAPSSTSANTVIPTSGAVYTAISSALTSVLKYKGTIGTGGTVTSLPASHAVGDVYVVSTAGTYAGKACEVGDYIICKTAGSSANNAHWDVVNGENQVENKSASLAAAGSSATIATIDGTNITVTTPSGWVLTDTKNTAGSTDTSSKIFLIGATSQGANPQTYSDNEVYATSGVLTTKSVQVGGTAATMQYNSTDQSIEFIFA